MEKRRRAWRRSGQISGDDAREDNAVKGSRAADAGHPDRTRVDSREVQQVGADQRADDTGDIGDGCLISRREEQSQYPDYAPARARWRRRLAFSLALRLLALICLLDLLVCFTPPSNLEGLRSARQNGRLS